MVLYVVARHLWYPARREFLGLFKSVGKITLELYLLQVRAWVRACVCACVRE